MAEAMIVLGVVVVLIALQALCWIIGEQKDKAYDRDRSYLYSHRHYDSVSVCHTDGHSALHTGQEP